MKIKRKYYFLDFVEVDGGVLDAADVVTDGVDDVTGVGVDEFVLLRTLLVELGDDALLLLFVVADAGVLCDSVFDLLLVKMLWLLTFAFGFEFTFDVVFVDVDTWLEEVLVVVEGVVAVLLLLLLEDEEEVGGDEEVAPVVVIVGNAPVFDIFVFEFELLIIAMPLLAFEIEDVVDVVE